MDQNDPVVLFCLELHLTSMDMPMALWSQCMYNIIMFISLCVLLYKSMENVQPSKIKKPVAGIRAACRTAFYALILQTPWLLHTWVSASLD